jgi:hypothetical protein
MSDTSTGNDISDMEFDEVSLVTRGANQGADVLIWKSAEDAGYTMDADGTIHRPDGSVVKTDGVDVDTDKHPLLKRIKAVFSNPTQESYDRLMADIGKALTDGAPAPTTLRQQDTRKDNTMTIAKADGTTIEAPSLDGLDDDIKKAFSEFIEEVSKTTSELVADNTQMAEAIAKADEDLDDEYDGDEEWVEVEDADGGVTKVDISKADPATQVLVKSLASRTNKAMEIAKAEQALRETGEMTVLAKGMTAHLAADADVLGPALLDIRKSCSEETYDAIVAVIKSGEEIAKTGAVMQNAGADGSGNDNDVLSKVDAAAKDLMAENEGMTIEVAKAQVLREDPDLYREHKAARLGR